MQIQYSSNSVCVKPIVRVYGELQLIENYCKILQLLGKYKKQKQEWKVPEKNGARRERLIEQWKNLSEEDKKIQRLMFEQWGKSIYEKVPEFRIQNTQFRIQKPE